MDEEWLEETNTAIDENPDRISHGGSAAADCDAPVCDDI